MRQTTEPVKGGIKNICGLKRVLVNPRECRQPKEDEMRQSSTVWIAFLILAFIHTSALAGITLSNSVICSGVGEPAGGTKSAWCTVGQAAVGTMRGSTYNTESGFWFQPTCIMAGVDDPEDGAAASYSLGANLPNPFRLLTAIRFSVPRRSHVSLKLYDVTGREVRIILDGDVEAGQHVVNLNAMGLASGVYFCQMVSGRFAESKKMLLLE